MICDDCQSTDACKLHGCLKRVMSPGDNFNVRNHEIEERNRELGRLVKDKYLPPGWGFCILMFNFGVNKTASDGLFYISNADRSDMIAAMKEFIRRNEN